MQKKSFLVTGAEGFIGSYLVNFLIKMNESVCVLVRTENFQEFFLDTVGQDLKKIRVFKGDITDKKFIEKLFKENHFDGVFHLAGITHIPTMFKEPSEAMRVNCFGTINVIDAIQKYQQNCRVLYLSSGAVYGEVKDPQGISEDFPLRPVNPYGVSKAAAEIYISERARNSDLESFSIRLFNVFGPRKKNNFPINSDAYQIARIKAGLQPPVIKVGNLEAKRTFVDVRDVAKALYLAMEKAEKGEAYNVGGNQLFSIREILDKMLEISGIKDKVKIEKDPALFRPSDVPVIFSNSDKFNKLTGWKPEIPTDETLKDVIDFY